MEKDFEIGEWLDVEIPEDEGFYLFYGTLWKNEDRPKRHHIVEVWVSGLAVCEGHFWNDREPEGKFARIVKLPTPE